MSALTVPLVASGQLVRLDVPVMIVLSALVGLLAADGDVGRGEGVALMAGLVVYTGFLVFLAKKQRPGPGSDETPAPSRSLRLLAISAASVVAGLVLLVLGAGWLV